MAKFNATVEQENLTTNLAGGEAYKESPKLEFVSLLLTSFVQDQFYRSENQTISDVSNMVSVTKDKLFLAKAAIFARTKYGMRSISHVAAAEIAKQVRGEIWLKRFFDRIVYRPDDMLEIASYYKATSGKKDIRDCMKKGFKSALERFDEYQLAKYRGEGKSTNMIDMVRTCHPKNTEAINKLIYGKLKSTDTWEAKISKAGKSDNKEEAKAEAWKELVVSRKIGYFALLRNLRNILEQAPEILPQALELLVDKKLIKKSLVLPFRFITALDEISKLSYNGTRDVLMALNKAVDLSLENVPRFDGKTLVVLDTSSSMGWYGNSQSPAKVGSLFSAILAKSNDADFMIFSNDAHYQALNPMDSTLTLANSIKFMGGGTNFHAIFETANRTYERIIILSDMQGWMGYNTPKDTFNRYVKRVGKRPKVYSFDLQGYGTLQFPERNVYCLAGFSDKVFDVMKLLETDRNALIKEIERVDI